MTDTESRARAVVEKFNDDCYMQPSDRACLETLIAAALREAEARGYEAVATNWERIKIVRAELYAKLEGELAMKEMGKIRDEEADAVIAWCRAQAKACEK